MNRKRGFTLIELLVVIVIIAILAAILFPVFARAKEKARQTSCMSNMKSLGLALNGYTADHMGRYPVSYQYGPTTPYPIYPAAYTYVSGCAAWPILLDSYVGGKPILKCKSDGSKIPIPPAPAGSGIPTEYSYAYNRNLGGVKWDLGCPGYNCVFSGWKLKWASTTDSPTAWVASWAGGEYGVHFPSKTVAFYETKGWFTRYASTTVATDGEGYKIPQPITDTTKAHSRHNGAANYTFTDGHVEYLKPDRIKGSTTNSLDATIDSTLVPGGMDLYASQYSAWWPDGFEDFPGTDPSGTHPTFNILF